MNSIKRHLSSTVSEGGESYGFFYWRKVLSPLLLIYSLVGFINSNPSYKELAAKVIDKIIFTFDPTSKIKYAIVESPDLDFSLMSDRSLAMSPTASRTAFCWLMVCCQ